MVNFCEQEHEFEHYSHLPYARQPFKSLYVFQRLVTTIFFFVPYWVIYYTIFPRPRPSWSLKQVINIEFTRRIYKVTEVAGVIWEARDPSKTPNQKHLKETTFEWCPPLPDKLRTGAVVSERVKCGRVGTYIWSNYPPPRSVKTALPDIESAAEEPVIGIFMHGGGYVHMSAHERSRAARIPRRLMKDKLFTEVYAVEYRLLQYAPFPGVLQDAAAVYANVVKKYSVSGSNASSNQSGPGDLGPLSERSGEDQNPPGDYFGHQAGQSAAPGKGAQQTQDGTIPPAQVTLSSQMGSLRAKIVLIGDSSGGNLALSLARWIRDENVLPAPAGLLLLSPSCDISHAFPDTPSSYVPRPNAETDYLVDTPEPRALLQRTFLGFEHHGMPLVYVNQITAMGDGDGEECIQALEERLLKEIVHSEYVSPVSPKVLHRWGHHTAGVDNCAGTSTPAPTTGTAAPGPASDALELVRSAVQTPSVLEEAGTNPIVAKLVSRMSAPHLARTITAPINPRQRGLFTSFPRTIVVVGDAERLTREITELVAAMEKDGVDVETVWAPDAAHDILIMAPGWWDGKVIEEVWRRIGVWMEKMRSRALV